MTTATADRSSEAHLWTPAHLPAGAQWVPERAARVEHFFGRYLVHTKSRYARQPFWPRRWQLTELLWPLFGICRYDQQTNDLVRQYNLAYLELAKRNGKTETLTGIGMYLLMADNEQGSEVYSVARDKEQASRSFLPGVRMTELSPRLAALVRRGVLRVYERDRRIVHRPSGSFWQVVPGDAAGNLGVNTHGVLFDEILTQKNRDTWDAFKTSLGSRPQSLMVGATTAGDDPLGLCRQEHDHSEQVQRHPELDPYRMVLLRNTPKDLAWDDEANWSYANPALGDFLSIETLRSEAVEARTSPAKRVRFQQWRLNQWTLKTSKWLSADEWEALSCSINLKALTDEPAWGGLDLASREDFAAWVVVLNDPDEMPVEGDEPEDTTDDEGPRVLIPAIVLPRLFLPEGALERRPELRGAIEGWISEGWVTMTPGRVLDQDAVFAAIEADAERFDLRLVCYDPWQGDRIAGMIEDRGVPAKPLAQTIGRMSAPSKELEDLLGHGLLANDGNPAMAWMVGNVEVTKDGNGNIKPDRKRSPEKIDGVVALVDALAARADPDGQTGGRVVMVLSAAKPR